jgi:hypothetical protein
VLQHTELQAVQPTLEKDFVEQLGVIDPARIFFYFGVFYPNAELMLQYK